MRLQSATSASTARPHTRLADSESCEPPSRLRSQAFKCCPTTRGTKAIWRIFYGVQHNGSRHVVAGLVGGVAQRPASPAAPRGVEKTRLLHGLSAGPAGDINARTLSSGHAEWVP